MSAPDGHVHTTSPAVPLDEAAGTPATTSAALPADAPSVADLNATLERLAALLAESEFRRRGNNALRVALSALMIFVTAMATSGSVSYCITSTHPSSWCAVIPGISAREARVEDDRRFSDLELRVTQLESSR